MIINGVAEPYLLIMEYVMRGKLLQHLREQRSKQTSFFQFSQGDVEIDEDDDLQGGGGEAGDGKTLTAKDLTKYAYGVAKGMEYIVSKGVRVKITVLMYCTIGFDNNHLDYVTQPCDIGHMTI